MPDSLYDLLVVGGGINGTGIARDAAGRGLRVLLCEERDLAAATSSASTKLIHGGLRYLEHWAFRLVRESLAEREVLLKAAPHLVRPLRFVLPLARDVRPAWLIGLGLFLYDRLGGRRTLPASRRVQLAGEPPQLLTDACGGAGFEYSDCWVDDSRLVILNALDAVRCGAEILTRTRCRAARRQEGHWSAELEPAGGAARQVRARVLVNAAGPWVNRFLVDALARPGEAHARLVKGSHLVVPRLHDGEKAYLLQNDDGRVVFVIPYEDRFSLIGTTELEHPSDPAVETITREEIDYLCRAVGRYFRPPPHPGAIVWSFSGLRPLFDDARTSASAVARDYRLVLDAPAGEAPLLTVYGGKITTYRRLAEEALTRLGGHWDRMGPAWTKDAVLPGGDLEGMTPEAFAAQLMRQAPWLPPGLARRYAGSYGSRAAFMLDGATGLEDLGQHQGDGLYEAEVRYLRDYEWARTARDILWRRSKLGLHVCGATVENLEMWLTTH